MDSLVVRLVEMIIKENCAKSSSTGERPQTSTLRQKRPFKIKIRSFFDGQKLVVGDICDEHNHDVSKTFYNHLPGQRKLHDDDKGKVREMLSVKANKKMAQHHLAERKWKVVLLKDIHNINTRIRPAGDRYIVGRPRQPVSTAS